HRGREPPRGRGRGEGDAPPGGGAGEGLMRRKTLLIGDDDESARVALQDYLEQRGYQVEEAVSCQAALASFRSSRPDAAILDYSLPDGTALDLMPRLKALDS